MIVKCSNCRKHFDSGSIFLEAKYICDKCRKLFKSERGNNGKKTSYFVTFEVFYKEERHFGSTWISTKKNPTPQEIEKAILCNLSEDCKNLKITEIIGGQ